MGLKVMAVDGAQWGVKLKMFLLALQSQNERTPLSQLLPRKEGCKENYENITGSRHEAHLNTAVLDTGHLLPNAIGGYHGGRHLVFGKGGQVQAPIRTPHCNVGITVVHCEACDVALQRDALPHFTLGNVVHVQVGASGYHEVSRGETSRRAVCPATAVVTDRNGHVLLLIASRWQTISLLSGYCPQKHEIHCFQL